jgi:hypothetical protein
MEVVMIRLELTEEEAAVLERRLESAVSDLRMEITSTDDLDYREGLKRDKLAMEHVISLLTRHGETVPYSDVPLR